MEANHISEINKQFNEKAINFINTLYSFEDKEVPKFTDNNEVLSLYIKEQNKINNELLWHRNNPISEIRLNAFRYFSRIGILPKSTEIILQSFVE